MRLKMSSTVHRKRRVEDDRNTDRHEQSVTKHDVKPQLIDERECELSQHRSTPQYYSLRYIDVVGTVNRQTAEWCGSRRRRAEQVVL